MKPNLPEWEPIFKRGEEYIPPTGDRPTKIVASAIYQNGKVWIGKRHCDLIHQVKEDGGEYVAQDQQGFWTESNRFVMRAAGYALALRYEQVKKENLINKHILTSEDLWA